MLLTRCALVAICLTVPPFCWGREIFHLTTGFSVEAKAHTRTESSYVLTTAAGTLEFAASNVEQIEVVTDPMPDAPASPAVSAAIRPEELIREAALSQGLPPGLVQSVARIESGLNSAAVSPKGAVGLMQLMPGTAAELGVAATDVQQNASGGAKYLRQLLLRYHNDAALALAAYNAGPGAVSKYNGVPPYAETRQYILRVLREYAKQQIAEAKRTANSSSATK
ncbi:MAG: lytic transglycosylase domain-containing protein [Acidobacteriaceae bacterium]|nr:lytic transglycosylase domain-containing protein [Acidobacteriaceae bacterium]